MEIGSSVQAYVALTTNAYANIVGDTAVNGPKAGSGDELSASEVVAPEQVKDSSTTRDEREPASLSTAFDMRNYQWSRLGVGESSAVSEEPSVSSAGTEFEVSSSDTQGLTEEERAQVEALKARDLEVRQHEQAHLAAAGSYANGGAQYEFQTGPDGKQYAIGGHVSIDTSSESDPQASIAKAKQIQRAALAPADPSPQDVKVAAQAAQMMQEAQRQLSEANEDDAAEGDGVSKITDREANTGPALAVFQ